MLDRVLLCWLYISSLHLGRMNLIIDQAMNAWHGRESDKQSEQVNEIYF